MAARMVAEFAKRGGAGKCPFGFDKLARAADAAGVSSAQPMAPTSRSTTNGSNVSRGGPIPGDRERLEASGDSGSDHSL